MKYISIPVTPFEQNCSIVWCETSKACAFIDPGGDVDELITAAGQYGLKPEAVFLTHAHLDHVGGAPRLAEYFDIGIIGPEKEDEFWLQALPQQSHMFNFPQCDVFKPDRWLQHGDTVRFGNETLEVRYTPGHTPGHVVLYSAKNKVVFVGDVLFKGSIGRTDFPRGDHQQLIASIKNQLWSLDDEVIVVPGHGPETTIGYERKTNPYLQ